MENTKLSFDQICDVVDQIKYKNWEIGVNRYGSDSTPYLQIRFHADGEVQKCRKWQLSFWMTATEIVRTAWKAILAAEEHEAAEKFLYKGAAVYNPHVDLDAMVEFAKQGNLASRFENEKVILLGDKRIRLIINEDTISAEFENADIR